MADPGNVHPRHKVDPSNIGTRQDFARDLTQLKEGAGLTIRDIAKSTGIPSGTVGDYFGGRHLPSARPGSGLPAILRACGVTEDHVVEEWLAARSRVRRLPGPVAAETPPPYRGLAAFETADADWFHGRESMVAEVSARLRENAGGLFVLVGPSGSGKSSFLRAGLVPAFSQSGGSADLPPQHILLLAPEAQPFEQLSLILAEYVTSRPVDADDVPAARPTDAPVKGSDSGSVDAVTEAAACFRQDPERWVSALLSKDASKTSRPRLVIIVDQFEQVFRECEDDAERFSFIEALGTLSGLLAGYDQETYRRPLCQVVLAMRADFYAQALNFPVLVSALRDNQIVIGPMNEAELRRTIVEPARQARVDLDEGLVEVLLREVVPAKGGASGAGAHDPGALPMLSHALRETWQRGNRRKMTVADYRATGGITGAIARTAEEVYEGLDNDQQAIVRTLFLRLVHIDEATSPTRRRVGHIELFHGRSATEVENLTDVLDRFVERRLITMDTTTVEIAHEALLTEWPRLQEWLDADRVGLSVHRTLTLTTHTWLDLGRDPTVLYRGPRLALARDLAAHPARRADLNPLEQEFLDASEHAERAEELAVRRRARRLTRLVAALTVLLLLATVEGVVLVQQRSEAQRQRDLAISQDAASEAEQLRTSDPNLAMQLNLAAYRTTPSPEALESLLDASATVTPTRLLGPEGVTGSHSVALSHDGAMLAAGYVDGSARLWNLRTGGAPDRLSSLPARDDGAVFALAFNREGTVLAVAGTAGEVRLWDITDPRQPTPLWPGRVHSQTDGGSTGPLSIGGTVYTVAFSPDGGTLMAAGLDGVVRLWDTTGRSGPVLIAQLVGPTGTVQSAAFSPDGHTLVAGDEDGVVWRWDVTGPRAATGPGQRLTGPTRRVHSVAFDPAGTTLAATGADGMVWRWNMTDPLRPLPEEPLTDSASFVNSVAFSPDGHQLAAGGSDGSVRLWDLERDEVVTSLPHPQPVTALAFAPNGHTLVTGAADSVTRLWHLPGPVLTEPAGRVFTVAFSPSGQTLAASGSDATVRMWDIHDPLRPVALGKPLTSTVPEVTLAGAAAFSPAGNLLAAGSAEGPVLLWNVTDPRTPIPVSPVLTGPAATVESVAFSSDGRLLAAGSDDRTVRLWDVSEPSRSRLVATLTGPAQLVYQVAFSPDGRVLAAGSVDETVRLWDVSDPTAPVPLGEPLTEPEGGVYSVAFSPDGKILAAADDDKSIRLWDVTNPARPTPLAQVLKTSVGHPFWLSFSPDGTTLASGNTDSTISLWDMREPTAATLRSTLSASTDDVFSAAFSPDGAVLAASGLDTVVRLWTLDPDRVADHICAMAGDPISQEEWERIIPGAPYQAPC